MESPPEPEPGVPTVTGRNAGGTWILIKHASREGWIFGPLTDNAADVRDALPNVGPQAIAAAPPVPALETVAPAPPPEPTPAAGWQP